MNLAKFIFNFLFEGKCKIVLTFSNNNPPAIHNFASPFVHLNDWDTWDSLHKCLCIIITWFCLFSCSFLLGKYSHDTRQRMSTFKFYPSALKYKFNIYTRTCLEWKGAVLFWVNLQSRKNIVCCWVMEWNQKSDL